jgi:hypothetical protein
MTGAWSHPPVGRVVPLAGLGAMGESLGQHTGESRRVCRLRSFPDWVLKEYPAPLLGDGVERLDRLIKLPEQMSAADMTLVDGHTSWPTSRVVDNWHRTIGVLVPLAPANFSMDRQMPGGRTQHKLLEVDVLALTESRQAQLKIAPQSLAERIAVCAAIAAVGALFERQGLVYLDWSYANVFWSIRDHSAYVIDMDGCSFGSRPQIQTPNWDDPLVPRGCDAGNESDRYRVALLISRCLTGRRTSLADTRVGLNALRIRGGVGGQVAQLLIQGLDARTTAERPSIARISTTLEATNGVNCRPQAPGHPSLKVGGVKQWRPVATRGNTRPKIPALTPAVPNHFSSQPVVTAGGRSSTSRRASNSLNHPPTRPPSVAPPERPSSSVGAVITALVLAIAIIIVLLVVIL